jgi:hypothetical protein
MGGGAKDTEAVSSIDDELDATAEAEEAANAVLTVCVFHLKENTCATNPKSLVAD